MVRLSHSRIILHHKTVICTAVMHARAIESCSSQTSETTPDNTSISISRAFCRAIADSSLIRLASSRHEQCKRKANWYVGINIVLSIEIFGPICFGRSVLVRRSTWPALKSTVSVRRFVRETKSCRGSDKATRRPRSHERSARASLFHASSLWS